MYKITEELDSKGFSINTVDFIINRNNGGIKFNTLDYFVIFMVFEKTELIVENKNYTIEPNHLVFIAPHKNLVYKETSEENTIIAFSSTFYEKSAKDSFILNSELFFNSNLDVFIAPAIGNKDSLKKLVLDRINLYKSKDNGIYVAVAHNCIEILLLDGLLNLEEKGNEISNPKSSYIETVNRFRVLLQKHYKTEKSVSFYSDILSVSPQRLSIMTKTVIGKGAKKMVVEKVAKEAKRMLGNTSLNISEIALELGFVDEANFSTFIKKNLGKSPSDLRGYLYKSEKNTN